MARRNGRFLVKRGIGCYTQMKYETLGKTMNRMKISPLSLRGAGIFFLMIALSLHACGRGGGSRHRGGRPPAAPTGVAVTAFSGAVVIGWDPVDGATSYHVYVAASSGVTKTNYETLPFGKRNPAAAGPFTQSDLFDGTTYYFVVTALNEAGESVESAEVSATPMSTALPLPPTGLRAIAADGQVTLEWNSVTGASSYFLYRATVSGINRDNWNTIVGGNRTQVPGGATVYIEDSLTNGTTYFFVVTAQNSLGQSEESAEVSATPFAADTVPVQPTNLTASAADSEVILHWNAAAGAQFYNVYWGTAAGVTPDNGTKISNLSGTSYTHTALTNNTTYHYILTAENAHGESLPSEEASAMPIPTPPPAVVTLPPSEVLKTGTAILHGEVNPLGFSGQTDVYFEWGTTTAYGGTTTPQTKPGGNTFVSVSDSLTGLLPNTPYHYRIVASNDRGTSFGADQSFILPFLGQPNEFPVRGGGSPNDVVVAKFDAGDLFDLAVVNFATHEVSLLTGNGDGTFDAAVHFPATPPGVQGFPQHLALGDFNKDGMPDLVVSNGAVGTMTLLLNTGGASRRPSRLIFGSIRTTAAGPSPPTWPSPTSTRMETTMWPSPR
ncbi:MAG: FG-GAP-like repeat-containing protein [Candidatus Manganitrophus sp.]|nr:MAG: FG-GAP-like repeat-containing protein [Candidatus Manganitrophus sp.]